MPTKIKPRAQSAPLLAATAYWRRFDFRICDGVGALKKTLTEINEKGWVIVSVTQFGHVYTVVFKRFD